MSKELKITKEKVLEASKQCEEARNVLKAMFPEAFEEEWVDVSEEIDLDLRHDGVIQINHKGTCLGHKWADGEFFWVDEGRGYKEKVGDDRRLHILKRK